LRALAAESDAPAACQRPRNGKACADAIRNNNRHASKTQETTHGGPHAVRRSDADGNSSMPHHRMVRAGPACDTPHILPIYVGRNCRDHGVPMRRMTIPILVLLAVAVFAWSRQRAPVQAPTAPATAHSSSSVSTSTAGRSTDALPPEVAVTLALIQRGGPFLHRQDGALFENRERELPVQPRGYYREFTVETPGTHDRGARRIITGGDPPVVYYYTGDHYRSFRTLEPTR